MVRTTGIPKIYQREDRRWATQLTLPSGKRKSIYGKTRAEVVAKLRKALADAEAGVLIGSGRETFESFGDRWLAQKKQSTSKQSVIAYHDRLRRVMPVLGRKRLEQLRPEDFMRAYRDLALPPAKLYATHRVVRQCLAWAVKLRILSWNPASVFDVPVPERRQPQAMTTEQIEHLLIGTEGTRFYALWALLIATGLRISEALALRWEDADLEGGVLRVEASLLKLPGEDFERGPTKTKKSKRPVEIGPELVTLLTAHRTEQKKERLAAAAWVDNDLVFCRPNGQPLHRNVPRRVLESALKDSGLPHFTLHELRHTAASALYAEPDIPLEWTQEILGHTDTRQTRHYSHLRRANQREVALRLDALLKTRGA